MLETNAGWTCSILDFGVVCLLDLQIHKLYINRLPQKSESKWRTRTLSILLLKGRGALQYTLKMCQFPAKLWMTPSSQDYIHPFYFGPCWTGCISPWKCVNSLQFFEWHPVDCITSWLYSNKKGQKNQWSLSLIKDASEANAEHGTTLHTVFAADLFNSSGLIVKGTNQHLQNSGSTSWDGQSQSLRLLLWHKISTISTQIMAI